MTPRIFSVSSVVGPTMAAPQRSVDSVPAVLLRTLRNGVVLFTAR